MLYKNCKYLPYYIFDEIIETQNLELLIEKKEKHTDEELNSKWVSIIEEYLLLKNDPSQEMFFRDKAEFKFLELKYASIKCLISISEQELSEDQKNSLEVIKSTYNIINPEIDILACKDDIAISLSKISNKVEEKAPSYEDILSSLRVNNIPVSRKDLTVAECVSLLKSVNEKNKANAARD